MKPVGHYAYQITWNDGHNTGIYPVSTIRQLGEPVG
ncbi:MAG: gamma-butyrobetaine hydroxylase-like domain-containing protein [Gemmataceae bacterium]